MADFSNHFDLHTFSPCIPILKLVHLQPVQQDVYPLHLSSALVAAIPASNRVSFVPCTLV